MTELATRIDVTINGVLYTDAEDATVSFGTDQIAGRIQVRFPNRRTAWQQQHRIEVWGGGGDSMGLLARGHIVTFQAGYSRSACKNPVTVIATNNGEKLQLPYQGDVGGADKDYAGQTDQAIVQNIAESMGVDPSLTYIQGSGRTYGTLAPVPWRNGEAGHGLIERLDDVSGYLTFCDRTNVLRRVQWTGIPSQSGAYHLIEGGNLRDMQETDSVQGMYNRVIIRGLAIEDTQIEAIREAPNDLIPDPPGFITYTGGNELIETVEHADEVAQYRLNELNRANKTYQATCDGIADLTPGMTITVTCPRLRITAQSFYVQHVDQHVTRSTAGTGDFESRLVLVGGYASDILIEPIPPVAMLSVSVFREYIDGEGPISVLVCDGSGSYDSDGSIVSWTWSTDPDATPPDAVTTTPYFTCYVPAAVTSVTITLLVTDSTAATGTISQVVTIDNASLPAETIWLAGGASAHVTLNGGETWTTRVSPGGNLTVLAPFGGSWGMLFGSDTGFVAVSESFLVDEWDLAEQIHEPGVACTAVWVTEQAEDRLWAAFADGSVYASIDRGGTWEPRGTIPGSGDVVGIQEGLGGSGTLRALRGTAVYISEDEGIQWDEVEDVGATAARMAFGFDHDFVGTAGGSPLVNNLKEGADPSIPSLTPGVGNVTGLTFGWKTRRLFLSDDTGRVLVTDPDFAAFEFAGWTNGITNHMVRSGSEEGVLYAATDQGFEKSIDGGATFFVSAFPAEEKYMVGFGAASNPPPPASGFLLVGMGIRTADMGPLAQYDPTAGWSLVNGPPEFGSEALIVHDVQINPFNPLEWLVRITHVHELRVTADRIEYVPLLRSPLWMTLDGGATWIEIDIPPTPETALNSIVQIPYVRWSDTVDGEWVMMVELRDSSFEHFAIAMIGGRTLQSSGPLAGTYFTHRIYHGPATGTWGIPFPFPGVGGEWGALLASRGIIRFTAGDTAFTSSASPLNGFEHVMRYPGNDRRIIGGRSGNRYATWSDYRDGASKVERFPMAGDTHMVAPTVNGVFTVSGLVFGEIVSEFTSGFAFVPINPPGVDPVADFLGFYGFSVDPAERRWMAMADQHADYIYLYDAVEDAFTTIPAVDVGREINGPRGGALWMAGVPE